MIGSTNPVPTYVTLADKKINVDFSKMPAPGTLSLGLIASLRNFPDRNMTVPFSVELSSSELQCLKTSDLKYYFGDPPLNFGVAYQNSTINTRFQLTAVKTPVALDSRGEEIDLPEFVKYEPKSGIFTISKVSSDEF